MDELSDRYLTTREVAAITRYDERAVVNAAAAGTLRGFQVVPGRSPWRFLRADVDRWMQGKPALTEAS